MTVNYDPVYTQKTFGPGFKTSNNFYEEGMNLPV